MSSGQLVSRTSSICAGENSSRENNRGGGEEVEAAAQPPPPQQQQQRRPTLLRVPSIPNQDVSIVNNNDVYESVGSDPHVGRQKDSKLLEIKFLFKAVVEFFFCCSSLNQCW